ncbi:DMT family transporter [Pseudooceanicola sediminis]|uniref:DMT family transporter n=2 Tax=Pseudooceanicola sediminis TaxID=2211117 RepID=A0A399J794_9RHOB|nr:DMT family transporter [Puniceibacterium sp. HSS470]RII38626.1 DMT family transporter [Pseudooceanicola sediminis]|tara:strand:+ start:25557 stop:26402 length:846 start_codon:yes stop_codon:yes gene_type:complete
MLAFSALVAGSFPLAAMAVPFVSPAALNALRFLLAAALVGAAALAGPGLQRGYFRAPWRYLLLGGIFAIYFVMMFEGLKTADPVSASSMFTLVPLMAAVVGWVLLRQVTTPRMALALAIGAAGALWVIFRADVGALMQFQIGPGERIYFIGCIAHAIYAPLVPKLNRGEPPVVFTFGMLVAGAVVLGTWGMPQILATDWAQLPAIVWITLAYTTICASAMTFVLLQYAAMRLPSAKVMAYTYLTPSWVILWQAALGRGFPPVMILGGVALTILALVILLKD